MKHTAMQELIDWFNEQMALAPKEMLPSERGLYNGYLNTKIKAERLLEKEKQIILDAFDAGFTDSYQPDAKYAGEANSYYNQTFKQH